MFFYLDVVVFDNTYSMLRSKKLRYHIAIIDCPDSESQTTAALNVGWEKYKIKLMNVTMYWAVAYVNACFDVQLYYI